jgi:hypothetical protein
MQVTSRVGYDAITREVAYQIILLLSVEFIEKATGSNRKRDIVNHEVTIATSRRLNPLEPVTICNGPDYL